MKFTCNFLLLIILAVSSCSGSDDPIDLSSNAPTSKPDTLNFDVDLGNSGDFNIHWSDSTITGDYPFNEWVEWHASWKGEYSDILAHCNVSMASEDSSVYIKNINDTIFHVKVDSTYDGDRYFKDRNSLSISPIFQPKKGYIIRGYWLDELVEYPKKVSSIMLTREMNWNE